MAVETGIGDVSQIVCAECDLDVVAAQGIVVRKLDIMRVEMAAVSGVFVMLDNYFTVEVVHYCSGVRCAVSLS